MDKVQAASQPLAQRMDDFQARLNRCFAKCQDEATDTLGVKQPDQSKAEVRANLLPNLADAAAG
jgi:Eukaryotic protein of unknown function (DUF842)